MGRLIPNDDRWHYRVSVNGSVVSSIRVAVGVDGVDHDDDNADVEIELTDQSLISVLFVTSKNVSTLLSRWEKSGEYGCPPFWRPENVVIVPDLRVETILSVGRRLASGLDVCARALA